MMWRSASGSSWSPCSDDVVIAKKTAVTVLRPSRETGSGSGRRLLGLFRTRLLTCLEVEIGLLSEDRLLQLLKRAARFEAELVEQHSPHVSVGSERVCLAAGSVEREHEGAAETLAMRMLRDQPLELAHEPRMAAERESRLAAAPRGRRSATPRAVRSRPARTPRRRRRRAASLRHSASACSSGRSALFGSPAVSSARPSSRRLTKRSASTSSAPASSM